MTETLACVSVDLHRDERAARLLGMAEGFWAQSGPGLAGPWHQLHPAPPSAFEACSASGVSPRQSRPGHVSIEPPVSRSRSRNNACPLGDPETGSR